MVSTSLKPESVVCSVWLVRAPQPPPTLWVSLLPWVPIKHLKLNASKTKLLTPMFCQIFHLGLILPFPVCHHCHLFSLTYP